MTDDYFTYYCKYHSIPLNSNDEIDKKTQLLINYNFGVPLEKMKNQSYKNLPQLFKLREKPSELEKDIENETENLLNLK